jgi:hypothetical protein
MEFKQKHIVHGGYVRLASEVDRMLRSIECSCAA